MQWYKPRFYLIPKPNAWVERTEWAVRFKRANHWHSPLLAESVHDTAQTAQARHHDVATNRTRFTVHRYGRPWFVAFNKGFAEGIVSAIKKRGEESSYHEGTEKPNKRSYERSGRVVLPSVKAAPQRLHSASSTHVHYWGEGGLPDKPHKFLVETYDLRLKAWVTTTSYDWQCVAESVRKPHQRIRIVADAASGYKTVQILHNDPRLPVA